jgi:tRNA threonylcarbamoyladenosine biosynthesis protein TsaE
MLSALPLATESATLALGAALGRHGLSLEAASADLCGRVLWLSGDLGAGKTTLVRGLLRSLGFVGRVKSPSYALLEPYNFSQLNLYHFDFYRFKDPEEWVSAGFREHFNPASLCIVEWPEKAAGLLTLPDLHLHLEMQDDRRSARFIAHTATGRAWRDASLAALLSLPSG